MIAQRCVFSKQSGPPILWHPLNLITFKSNIKISKISKYKWYLFSPNLWGYFAEFLNNFSLYALVFSTYEPVSV